MPDWLIERGIGETRAVRVADGEIVESRIMIDGIARGRFDGSDPVLFLHTGGAPALFAYRDALRAG